jgi:methylmalonyl-CoA/ethylmalonyl-CoA epimerase
MGAIRFDHIAIGAHRMANAVETLVGALGGTPAYGHASRFFRWGLWTFEGGGGIEVLEPRGEDGFLHRFLAARGPSIHHVTFRVPSLVEVCARARANGYEVVGYDDSEPTWKEAFLHPKQALGIVVQFAESEADGPPAGWVPPPGPPDPPPPVRVLGLRLRARSRERAERQWSAVLDGTATERDGQVVYRWPDSPMRIAVDVDPSAEEGPVAIEFSAAHDVNVPAGSARDLGTTFRRVR